MPLLPSGDVSALINETGMAAATSVLEPGAASLRRQRKTNLLAPLALVGPLNDCLTERSGAVLIDSSVMAWRPVGGSYTVGKAAMSSANDVVRAELAARDKGLGSHVSFIDTDTPEKLDRPKSHPADVRS